METNIYDILVIVIFVVGILGTAFWKGRGKRETSGEYFISKGTLPWWVIGAAFVASGMNTEQLVGINGISYKIGLPIVNCYVIVWVVYSLLIFIFLPVYLKNGIVTMPEYVSRRFSPLNANIFTVMLLLSYIFLSLAVVLYGGAKLLEVVMGLKLFWGVAALGIVAGLYTMYGGMAAQSYAAVVQFVMIFTAGAVLFILAYLQLPNGWSDVVANSPCGFHIMRPANYPEVPWQAIPASLLGLQLYYSCINQSLVQRCFGAKTQWDAKMAIIFAGFAVAMRPFVEILPGIMARALSTINPQFDLTGQSIDNTFPTLIKVLVPVGFRGLILIGTLAIVMSCTSALLNSISTLFTMDIYKKWFRKAAGEHEMVKVGTIATLVLTVFSIFYAPYVGKLGGSIFNYFQTGAAFFAVPVATIFIFGFFWKRSSPAAALFTLITAIPIGIWLTMVGIPHIFSAETVAKYSLTNRYIASGITQGVCAVLFIIISLLTKPKPVESIASLMWTKDCLYLPKNEPKRPLLQSLGFWWVIFVLMYLIIYAVYW